MKNEAARNRSCASYHATPRPKPLGQRTFDDKPRSKTDIREYGKLKEKRGRSSGAQGFEPAPPTLNTYTHKHHTPPGQAAHSLTIGLTKNKYHVFIHFRNQATTPNSNVHNSFNFDFQNKL